MPPDQFQQEGIVRQIVGTVQVRERFVDPSPDTVPQFRRRRPRERHDEDLLHFQLFFKQQTQVQTADVPCFARACRGLDQNPAGKRAVENIEFIRKTHEVSPFRKPYSGAKTRFDNSMKSLSSGLPTPRIANCV